MKPILIVHGGAGTGKPKLQAMSKMEELLSAGYYILKQDGHALDAVTEAIRLFEDSGLFNAGAGGNLQLDGVRRLDASLMEGKSMRAGSVVGLEGIRNPILTARVIMDLPHVMLTNKGARKIAKAEKLPPLPSSDESSLGRLKKALSKKTRVSAAYEKYFSTVGAVALDSRGNLAAGCSTGGVPGMLPGRVGDTPVIGAGVYAENGLGAVACTGIGEYILRISLAKEICMRMEKRSPYRAAQHSLVRLMNLGGQAGVIVVNPAGRFTIVHTSEHMASGYASGKRIVVQDGFRRLQQSTGR